MLAESDSDVSVLIWISRQRAHRETTNRTKEELLHGDVEFHWDNR